MGCVGFIKSIKRFDTSFEVKLSTYTVPYILGEIKRYIRDDGTVKISRSIKELQVKIKQLQELIDKIATEKDEQELLTNKIAIRELIKDLPKEDKEIIMLRYYKQKTQKEVAKIIGITQVQVSRMEKKILEKLRMHSLN